MKDYLSKLQKIKQGNMLQYNEYKAGRLEILHLYD